MRSLNIYDHAFTVNSHQYALKNNNASVCRVILNFVGRVFDYLPEMFIYPVYWSFTVCDRFP